MRLGTVGRPPGDHRPIVNAILWVLHTGAPWRSGTHIDVVGLGFNIWLESEDGPNRVTEQIMRDGRFLIAA